MLASKIARLGARAIRELRRGPLQPSLQLIPSLQPVNLPASRSNVLDSIHQTFCSTAANKDSKEGAETINVTFVDKDGEEQQIKVPVGMSMLEAAHENDIELEGACEGSLACSTCHVIVMDVEQYNKLEDPSDEENDMLDLAFGLTETSRLVCQVIAKPELDGIRLGLTVRNKKFCSRWLQTQASLIS